MTPSITPDQYRAMTAKPAKGNKYNAKRTQRDGMWFDSQREADRWSELKLLERAGTITELQRQVTYPLANEHIDVRTEKGNQRTYRADFVYRENGRTVIEDVKGHMNETSALKIDFLRAMNVHVRVVR